MAHQFSANDLAGRTCSNDNKRSVNFETIEKHRRESELWNVEELFSPRPWNLWSRAKVRFALCSKTYTYLHTAKIPSLPFPVCRTKMYRVSDASASGARRREEGRGSRFYLRRSTQVYKWHFLFFSSFLKTSQNSHLKASNTVTAQSRDVWNENLESLRWSAVCSLSAVCLLFSNKPLRYFRCCNCS